MKSPVIEYVVKNDLCIGCGLCAALCPQSILKVEWNQYGEYNPVETTACPAKCGLCLNACPFYKSNPNEDSIGEKLYGSLPDIKHLSETGYYLDSYVAYSQSNEHRQQGASGGMVTWLLEVLLERDIVDYVICVTQTSNPDRLFSFEVFLNSESVRSSSGSAYYPVEMSGVIQKVLEIPGRYVITGLPCFIKALRLAQQHNKKLRDRIVVTIGLNCGQLKSKHYTPYLAYLGGVKGNLIRAHFRGKDPGKPANNYYFSCTNEENFEGKVFWSEGMAEAWVNRWFTPNACNYCDDIFAECADVTFMDAWLPEYSKDYRGTNLIVVRSPLINDLIAIGVQEGDILADPVPIQNCIRSQAGVVDIKRRHLAYRLYLDQHKGLKVMTKRVSPARPKNPFLRQEVTLKDHMRVLSREFCGNCKNQDVACLREEMQPYLKKLASMRRTAKIINLPVRTARYIQSKL